MVQVQEMKDFLILRIIMKNKYISLILFFIIIYFNKGGSWYFPYGTNIKYKNGRAIVMVGILETCAIPIEKIKSITILP